MKNAILFNFITPVRIKLKYAASHSNRKGGDGPEDPNMVVIVPNAVIWTWSKSAKVETVGDWSRLSKFSSYVSSGYCTLGPFTIPFTKPIIYSQNNHTKWALHALFVSILASSAYKRGRQSAPWPWSEPLKPSMPTSALPSSQSILLQIQQHKDRISDIEKELNDETRALAMQYCLLNSENSAIFRLPNELLLKILKT